MTRYLVSCETVDGVRTAMQSHEDLDLIAELSLSFLLVRGTETAVTQLPWVEYVEKTDRTTF